MQNAECKIIGEAKLPNIINGVFKSEPNNLIELLKFKVEMKNADLGCDGAQRYVKQTKSSQSPKTSFNSKNSRLR